MAKRQTVRNWLIIMAREPRLGRVKTRLARDIGAVEATRIYRTVATNVIYRLARDPRWRTVVAITPDSAVTSPVWPRHVARISQGHGDIGTRMRRLLATNPYGPVVVIGSDVPGVRAADIALAFRNLGKTPAVFGPADDGGFWLIGANRLLGLKEAFRDVRWSSEHALDDTLANLRGRAIGYAAQLADVDTAASFVNTSNFGLRG